MRRAELGLPMFQSIDEGLEWCEDRMLKFRCPASSSRLLLAVCDLVSLRGTLTTPT